MNNDPIKREIRSFARRSGRLSTTQKTAIKELWGLYGIDYDSKSNAIAELTKADKPLKVEIGFGNGDSLIEMAKNDPDSQYIGIEVHTPGIGRILKNIADLGLTNLKVMSHDAMEILRDMLPSRCLSRVFLFFPDPWHKARHNKRRIVNQKFRDLLALKLLPKGVIHMATDWQDYADHMVDEFLNDERFYNLGDAKGVSLKPDYRPQTKFERRGLRLEHAISDLLFTLKD
ncbi:MAG: tRNA (guanosine(46)-N7)-methyltransferase TrmB [Gammaproteobacteria bacterium]|nr:tRNA (guanosine(46)-N7)-methyltransferase TrmB [Gammaproteobacteria bacterium]